MGGRTSSSGMNQQSATRIPYSSIASDVDSAEFKKMSNGQLSMETAYGGSVISSYIDESGERSYAIDVHDANGKSITAGRGYTLKDAKRASKHALKSIYDPDKPTSVNELKKAGSEGYQKAVKAADKISSGSTLTIKSPSGETVSLVKGVYSGFEIVGGGGIFTRTNSVEVAQALMRGDVIKFKSK